MQLFISIWEYQFVLLLLCNIITSSLRKQKYALLVLCFQLPKR